MRGIFAVPLAAVTGLTLAVVFAACGSDGDNIAADLDTRSTGPVSTVADDDARQAVLDAYAESWDAYLEAAREPSNPDSPRLPETRTGANLEVVRRALAERRDTGQAIRGDLESHPEIRSLRSTTAVIRDCIVENIEVIDVATGEVKVPIDDVPQYSDVTMVLEGGKWKISEFDAPQPGQDRRCDSAG